MHAILCGRRRRFRKKKLCAINMSSFAFQNIFVPTSAHAHDTGGTDTQLLLLVSSSITDNDQINLKLCNAAGVRVTPVSVAVATAE